MERKEFEKLVVEGFALLPEKFRAKIRNVAFLVEDAPSEEVRREAGLSSGETLLGFYRGVPNPARGEEYGVGPTLPDAIIVYQKPIEDEARERIAEASHNKPLSVIARSEKAAREPFRKAVREIVAETVWHEVGHYFGLDEEDIEAREKKRSDFLSR
ncbi:MAG: hypothetical protein Greene041679_187 [Parcubacteria group bacterium Greene0416_79]|nr:MAG: hypothetical protein Greene041679_187 [Parcubacteria group bacterium Greene0416_79]